MPKQDGRPTKAEKRLSLRQKSWDTHGKTPQPSGTDMHRPGSLKK